MPISQNIIDRINQTNATESPDRPFSVFGYVDNGKYYGGGWDGIAATNICGFSEVHVDNIYIIET